LTMGYIIRVLYMSNNSGYFDYYVVEVLNSIIFLEKC
jgi:hypothetical protein